MCSEPPLVPDQTIRPAWHRIAMWVVVFAGIAIALKVFLGWAMGFMGGVGVYNGSTSLVIAVAFALVIYTILIAIPFMPGIEVGIALLMLQGATIAPFVYIATVTGLMSAYLIGCHVPYAWLRRLFTDFGLRKAAALLDQIENTPPEDRLVKQRAMLPVWLRDRAFAYRYLALGVLLNIPGTFAIGGGGGIMMTAGVARLFDRWAIFLTICVATLPVPLLVWLWGYTILGTLHLN